MHTTDSPWRKCRRQSGLMCHMTSIKATGIDEPSENHVTCDCKSFRLTVFIIASICPCAIHISRTATAKREVTSRQSYNKSTARRWAWKNFVWSLHQLDHHLDRWCFRLVSYWIFTYCLHMPTVTNQPPAAPESLSNHYRHSAASVSFEHRPIRFSNPPEHQPSQRSSR